MRFQAVHKASSYLMVASAFAAVALSGELPLAWIAFTAIAGAASYLVEPTRAPVTASRAWRVGWNLVAFALFAWSIAEAIRGEPLVLCIVRLACFLLVFKLWNRRSSKDYLQAYAVSFIMLAASAILNTDIAFALCFVAYVVTATWTLTLFHLRREMEENYLLKHSDDAQSERVEVERILNSRRVVGPAFLAATSLVSLGIFLGSAMLFFLFPRVGFGIFSRHARAGMRVGFNDNAVELGQNGLIKDNEQVVMRVEFPDGKPVEPLYFRGVAFERYERAPGGRSVWTTAPGVKRRELAQVAGVAPVRGIGPLAQATARAPRGVPTRAAVRQALAGALKQEIYLEPMGETTALFAASTPIAVALPSSRVGAPGEPTAEGDPLGDVFAPGRASGIKYTAYSTVKPPPPADDGGDARPEEFAPSLQLPAELPPRIVALARDITRGARGPRAKAEAVQRYLGEHYRYTIDLKRNPAYDPLEDFLFVEKAGHCEYFATAMAILLRAVGVPTRHVAGFYGGEWNPYGHYLQVRQRDAHAWVEVWLGAAGWVTFDPTPPGDGAIDPGGFGDRLRQLVDLVQLAWFKWVIEYDLGKQVDLFQQARRWFAPADSPTESGLLKWLAAHKVAIGVGVILLVAAAWWRFRARARAVARARSRSERRALNAVERAMRALDKRGTARAPAETAAELAARAARNHDPGAEPFRELVDLYYAARFGGVAVDAAALDRLAARVVRPPPSATG